MADLKLELALSSGIPEAYTQTLKFLQMKRETTDLDLRRRLDLIEVVIAEWFWFEFIGLPKPADSVK